MNSAAQSLDRHLSRLPIKQLKPRWFALLNAKGKPISFHRTISGALRARREQIEAS